MASEPAQDYIWSRGLQFPNRPDIVPDHSRAALRENRFERWEHRAVIALADAQDHVLELGGGLGFLSTLLSVKSPVKSVTTLEPNPILAGYIAEVHELNNAVNARVIKAVAGPDTIGSVPFYIRKNVLASSLDAEAGAKPAQTIDTDVVDINALIKERHITYLICDIEGGEADLIDILEPDPLRAITIELHPQKIGTEATRDIFDKLHENGLIYVPDASFGKVVSFVRDKQLSSIPLD